MKFVFVLKESNADSAFDETITLKSDMRHRLPFVGRGTRTPALKGFCFISRPPAKVWSTAASNTFVLAINL